MASYLLATASNLLASGHTLRLALFAFLAERAQCATPTTGAGTVYGVPLPGQLRTLIAPEVHHLDAL